MPTPGESLMGYHSGFSSKYIVQEILKNRVQPSDDIYKIFQSLFSTKGDVLTAILKTCFMGSNFIEITDVIYSCEFPWVAIQMSPNRMRGELQPLAITDAIKLAKWLNFSVLKEELVYESD